MSQLTIEDVIEFVDENDVKFIRLAFCDLYGNQKNISIMPKELRRAFDEGVSFDSFLILGYDDPDFQDLRLKPDPDTLHVLPWRPQSGRVIRFYCDIVLPDGSPYPYDYRNFLKQTIIKANKLGLDTKMGLRSEFYLFKTDENGKATDITFDEGGYFDVAPSDKGENIRREICLTLEEMGINPESSHHERGPGQNEIDFVGGDVLKTADNFVTYKNVVSNIAARNGAFASFDPKPIENQPGNGLHVKLLNYKNGVNIYDCDSELSESFMAGIFNRMKDITLFLNCREDSYKRFGQSEAPKYITWSSQSRSRLLRVPETNGKRDGFILRSPDSCVNPYMASAILIQAGLEGMKNKEKLPKPQDISSRKMKDEERKSMETLPLSLQEAIDCAKNSEFLKNSDFAPIVSHYITIISKEF